MLEHVNGGRVERPSDLPSDMGLKRKRYHVEPKVGYKSYAWKDRNNNVEYYDDFENHISEENYHNILEEHVRNMH